MDRGIPGNRGLSSGQWAAVACGFLCLIASFGFPDIDIRLLGIGWHRFFLTHSVLIPLFVDIAARARAKRPRLRTLPAAPVVGFYLGVGLHLLADVFQSKSVVFPFVGSLIDGTSADDRIWIGVNAAACFLLAFRLAHRRFGK